MSESPKKDVFAYPAKMRGPSEDQKIAEAGLLLWRVVQRRSESRNGQAKMFREPFLRNAVDVVSAEDEQTRLGLLRDLLLQNGRYHVPNFEAFQSGIAADFQKELDYRSDRARQFSADILFQVIELISLGKSAESAQNTIESIGSREDTSISERDRRSLLLHYRAYVDVQKRIANLGSVREALDNKEQLLLEAAWQNPEITLSALAAMLRTLVAQHLLDKKYSCDALMVEWMKEYGFGPLHILKVSRLVPMDSPLGMFRSRYTEAIRGLRSAFEEGDRINSDLFLLRSLSNFYTSWTMKVAAMLPA